MITCYYPIRPNKYAYLYLTVEWVFTCRSSSGELLSTSTFNEKKRWTYTEFKPYQLENRDYYDRTDERPEVIPCNNGYFTLYQECCNPGAYRRPYQGVTNDKDTYGNCYKSVYALFDGTDEDAGKGFISGLDITSTPTGEFDEETGDEIIDETKVRTRVYIECSGQNESWDAAGDDGVCVFKVKIPYEHKIPYQASGIEAPTRKTGMASFEYNVTIYYEPGEDGYIEEGNPGYPAVKGASDADTAFYFAFRTARKGRNIPTGQPHFGVPDWECYDNYLNMNFNSSVTAMGTYRDYNGNVVTVYTKATLDFNKVQ